MKSQSAQAAHAAPIVTLADAALTDGSEVLARARAFAEPLLAGRLLNSGEPAWSHADGVAGLLAGIGGAPGLQAAAYLVHAADALQRPEDVLSKAFGPSYAELATLTRKLVDIQQLTRDAAHGDEQLERVRKMLLAFSRDLRVVLLRLASRLQTLRWHAQSKTPCPAVVAREAQQVFAPLANRLGIWQFKWELEDYALRFSQPEVYRDIAQQLASTRIEREGEVEALRAQVEAELGAHGVAALVSGRPKHIYSIWKKMQGKKLAFERVMDVRALRVIVADVPACYAALSRVHARWASVSGEFDDYIAKPKPNGYRSLHTVVMGDDGKPVEIQIRTQAMHEHAEYGVAAHWAYKEAGAKGYGGVSAAGSFEEKLAEVRKNVLRQLLAWEQDLVGQTREGRPDARFDDRIYVFTPQGAVVELAAGATPIDFAYALHTDLGHRCRGAHVDGALVTLPTPLKSGQTVDIVTAKTGGPSRDWLNPELGFLRTARARAKVRAWFNAAAQAETIARGREAVERLLQREGRTAIKLADLAEGLGFKDADALFAVVGKDELSLRQIEHHLRPAAAPQEAEPVPLPLRAAPAKAAGEGVLVVGVESLLTQLARCCRPAPPDAIAGYVTRGSGVAVHRADCSNLRHMAQRHPERVIAVDWGEAPHGSAAYPVDVIVLASERAGLVRDVGEVFAKHKLNLTDVRTQSTSDAQGRTLRMQFTVQVPGVDKLRDVLTQVAHIPGVRSVRRR